MIRQIIISSIVLMLGYSNIAAKKTALLIGIGNYRTETTGWSIIHGNNDVAMLEKKLRAKGFSVSCLTDGNATKKSIKTALSKLATSVSAGDVVYLHFSGHGQLIYDMNNDEQEDFDQSFVCYDACLSPQYKIAGINYYGQNHFVDDELFPYLNNLKGKVGKSGNVIIVFDTCYSGGADRGEETEIPDPEGDVEFDKTTRGTDDEFKVNKSIGTYLRSLKKPGNYTHSGGKITIISACESDAKNYECKERRSGRKYGTLSYCIGKMLDNNIPLDQWAEFFSSNKYRTLRIFRQSQTPVVEIYK